MDRTHGWSKGASEHGGVFPISLCRPPFKGDVGFNNVVRLLFRCVEGFWPGLPFNMFAFLPRLNDGKCVLPRHVAACGRGCDGNQQMLQGWESSLS